eukprot:TRINITY_DN8907_c0_g5_i3.p2 TRINITY_DN8907_c0_g5~~TRINITY_DN8907_c0_g5_i3.p2  ORF type:complete len:105 (+),score=5.27 TRINITY_DN8907_c0_g5_i3:130-444(+)
MCIRDRLRLDGLLLGLWLQLDRGILGLFLHRFLRWDRCLASSICQRPFHLLLSAVLSRVKLLPSRAHLHDSRSIGFPVLCVDTCLLYTSPSPRDRTRSRMPSSA